MIENFARVAKVEGGEAWIEAARPVGCGHCHENPACAVNRGECGGAGNVSLFRVANPIDARAGDRVIVGVADGAVWRVALLVYLLPLGLALAGAVLAQTLWGGQDGTAVLGAVLGLALGLFWSRAVQGRARNRELCHPVILRRDVSSS